MYQVASVVAGLRDGDLDSGAEGGIALRKMASANESALTEIVRKKGSVEHSMLAVNRQNLRNRSIFVIVW